MSQGAPSESLIGWIGCGKLGQPMAEHLISAGYALQVYDLDMQARHALDSRGARPVDSVAAVCAGASVVFTSLPDDAALIAVACGEQGVLNRLEPGAILVETSTVSPAASMRVAAHAVRAERAYLRVAVSGNPVIARAAQLTTFASGSAIDHERIEPLLSTFSKRVFRVGEAEQARTLKLVINLMIAVSAGMLGEALALGEKGGLDWRQMLEVMSESAVGSPMVKYKAPPLGARDYTSTFSCAQMAKDLDLILGAAAQFGAPVPMAAHMRQVYEALMASGSGGDDYIATVRHAEKMAGIPEPLADASARAAG